MKRFTTILFALAGIAFFASSCDKRVDCLCTATPVDNRNEDLEVTSFYVTFKDGGDCDDASGPFYHTDEFQREFEYNATCEEIPQEQMFPEGPEGGEQDGE